MDEQPKSKGAQVIEELMRQLPQESERYKVLASARRFKSSWVELGEWLARVSNGGQFQEWGFSSFEDYCSKEIRIRRQTAEKLLLAFRFLKRKEPSLLERRRDRPLPDYRSVDLLRQADEQEHFSLAEYSELRQAVFEDERSHPTVAKQFKEIAKAYRQDDQSVLNCRTALSSARRLATSLQGVEEVPEEMSRSVEGLIVFLQGRVDEMSEQVSEGES